MPDYRLYFLIDNHIRHVVAFACRTDDEALASVDEHADGRAMELWQGARRVQCFEAVRPVHLVDDRSAAPVNRTIPSRR